MSDSTPSAEIIADTLSKLRIMNAAGQCKLVEHVRELARSAVTDITVGSVTVEPREGNSGATFWYEPETGAALNSLGLPNPGLSYYEQHLREMVRIAHDAGKKLRLNVAGFSAADYRTLFDFAATAGIDEVEGNYGCPNVVEGSIIAYDPALLLMILLENYELLKTAGLPQAAKMSPYADPTQLRIIAQAVAERFPSLTIVACNTFPDAFAWDRPGKSIISPREGLAGLSGTALKFIVRGQIHMWRSLLNPTQQLVAVGGIKTGRDVLELIALGANGGVQVGTHSFVHGAGVFSTLLTECIEDPYANEFLTSQ